MEDALEGQSGAKINLTSAASSSVIDSICSCNSALVIPQIVAAAKAALLVVLGGCGLTGSEVRGGAEAAENGAGAARNLGEGAGRYHGSSVNPGGFDAGQSIGEVAATKADGSAQLLSEALGSFVSSVCAF